VMLAKTESAEQLQAVAAARAGTPLIALIETAAALFAAPAIARGHPQLQALMLGGADLSAELGCDFAWEPLLFARGQLVAAAAVTAPAQLGCIDVPFLNVADADACRAEAARVAALGFTAKALIHPSQAAPVHAGFAPTPAALAHAQRVVEATTSGGGALLVDGKMVDRPVLIAAQRTLRRAGL
jgi:citrate lyase beta subunit